MPVSVEERVAITVWKLATNVEYRTLSALFGLGRSTVCTIVIETSHTIASRLLPQYVQIPQGERLKEIVEGFETYWGFPQAAGAIDGTHIPIIRPDESASDYYNRKGYYSIIMQAMVDFRGLFMDVYIGWPGKVHDARVFVNSSLYQKGRSSTLFPDWKRNISGVEVCNLYTMSYCNVVIHCFCAVGAIGGAGRPCISCSSMANEAFPGDGMFDSWPKSI